MVVGSGVVGLWIPPSALPKPIKHRHIIIYRSSFLEYFLPVICSNWRYSSLTCTLSALCLRHISECLILHLNLVLICVSRVTLHRINGHRKRRLQLGVGRGQRIFEILGSSFSLGLTALCSWAYILYSLWPL